MTAINRRQVWLGTLVGGLVWNVLSIVIHMGVLGKRYEMEQAAGHFLAAPRCHFFYPLWILLLFVLAGIVSLLYASVRATCGAGPKTALAVGLMVGFAAGFPAWSRGRHAVPVS